MSDTQQQRFEASQIAQGRQRSALYRTPDGEYEDDDVARAWRLWQSLGSLLVEQLRRPRGIGPQHQPQQR